MKVYFHIFFVQSNMKQKETKLQYCFPMESSCSKLLLLLLIDSSENQSMKGGGVKKGMGHS